MAGFEVIVYGRFWVITEVSPGVCALVQPTHSLDILLIMYIQEVQHAGIKMGE